MAPKAGFPWERAQGCTAVFGPKSLKDTSLKKIYDFKALRTGERNVEITVGEPCITMVYETISTNSDVKLNQLNLEEIKLHSEKMFNPARRRFWFGDTVSLTPVH